MFGSKAKTSNAARSLAKTAKCSARARSRYWRQLVAPKFRLAASPLLACLRPVPSWSNLARVYAPAKSMKATGSVSRSEEHTSELQSQSNLVCRLLLEKKKRKDAVLPVPVRDDHAVRVRRS